MDAEVISSPLPLGSQMTGAQSSTAVTLPNSTLIEAIMDVEPITYPLPLGSPSPSGQSPLTGAYASHSPYLAQG
jgi:hypothetical protein